MTNNHQERLAFLNRVVSKEIQHLRFSATRVFDQPLDVERAATLANDEAFAERVEAFASRFCRLQDTVGDKLLPVWLQALGEKRGAVVDNRVMQSDELNGLDSAWAVA
jgi:hypothetical protein